MHYYRLKIGITNMSPNRLSYRGWDKRPQQKRICSVEGCEKRYFAKGYCHKHYALYLRKGHTSYYRDIPKPKCSVQDCSNLARGRRDGFCKFHFHRKRTGVALDRPKGIKGNLNPRWNGGISEYPDHFTMKKIRKIVLKEENYTCNFCGHHAEHIHHLDHSKSNHSRSNLVACCQSCNLLIAGQHKSKYKNAYGMKMVDIAKKLNVHFSKVSEMHRNGTLRKALHIDEIQAVIF